MPPAFDNSDISFIDFWHFIADALGNSHLKLNDSVADIHSIFDQRFECNQYLKKVVLRSYKDNQCMHLRSAIDVNKILDILGDIAHQLRLEKSDDLIDIELLEEIGWLIGERYHYAVEHVDPIIEDNDARVVAMRRYGDSRFAKIQRS